MNYGMCLYYVPFVMGGDVWQPRRYKVENVKETRTINGIDVFLQKCPIDGMWRVTETTTGGLLGQGNSEKKAFEVATDNIESTPDLKDQMAKFGPVENHPEVDYTEAHERFSRS